MTHALVEEYLEKEGKNISVFCRGNYLNNPEMATSVDRHLLYPPASGAKDGSLFCPADQWYHMPLPEESKRFFAADSFAHRCGIELLEVAPGRARVKMEIGEGHANSHGTVHGGAIFTLADTAFALASNSHGIPAAAINAHISYLKSAREGTLYAEAEEFSLAPKIASYTVQVTDEQGERIAIFQGMVYRKSPPRRT